MKLYISKSDPETLYHDCANSNSGGSLFSTYKIENGFVICGLHNGKNLCQFRVSPFIFLGFRKSLEEQKQSTIYGVRNFIGEIIEMEDSFGDR